MPAGKQTGVHVEGVNVLLRTISRMDRAVGDEIRTGAVTIAERFLMHVEGAASGSAESKAAAGLRVYRDRVPKVGFAGGTSAGVSGGARMGEFFGGHEFGSNQGPRTRQFPRASAGYFFYPTLRRHGHDYAEQWFKLVADAAGAEWEKGARQV